MTVGLEDANRSGRSDPVRVQEDHDLAHGFLLGPARHNARRPPRPDARHLGQAFRCGLDDLERVLAKGGHDALGHGWTDAAHLTGGEILLDPLSPGRGRGLEHVGFELKPVHAVETHAPVAVIHSPAPIAGAWPTTVTRSRLAACLDLEDAKAILGVVEGDALDRARERLDRRASLHLTGADHLVHAPAQGTTAALAP